MLENLRNLAESPLENPGKEFYFTVGHHGYSTVQHITAQYNRDHP